MLSGHSNADALEEWSGEALQAEHTLLAPADVRRPEELEAVCTRALERFGRLDVCAANAGIWPAGDELLDELPLERLRDTLDTNLLGALFTARSFFAALRRTGPRADGHGAALTFTGSTAGQFGERGHVDYAAAKSALVGAARTLKNEIVLLDPFARVNVVQPGWTVTHMARPALQEPGTVERVTRTMALRQLARAKDIARTVLFLSSPLAARHVTGEVVTVAGGMEGRTLWGEEGFELAEVLRRLETD